MVLGFRADGGGLGTLVPRVPEGRGQRGPARRAGRGAHRPSAIRAAGSAAAGGRQGRRQSPACAGGSRICAPSTTPWASSAGTRRPTSPRRRTTGAATRLATVESLRRRLLVDDELGDLIEEAAAQAPRDERLLAELDHLRRLRRIALALPDGLVRRLRPGALPGARRLGGGAPTRTTSPASRPPSPNSSGSSASGPRPCGSRTSLYDGLLDEHEPGMTRARLEPLLAAVGERLVAPRPGPGRAHGGAPRPGCPRGTTPTRPRSASAARCLRDMGFDFSRGRIDRSTHPCTILAGGRDVRITLRFPEDDPLDGIFSALHEGGHALYDQGFDPGLDGTLLAEGAGMGLHESQARLWENHVGRSRAFWEHYLPALRELFPSLPARRRRRRHPPARQRRPAGHEPRGGRRGHLQSPHPPAVPARAGAARRRPPGGGAARGMGRRRARPSSACGRPATWRAASRTSTGASGSSATSPATPSAIFMRPSSWRRSSRPTRPSRTTSARGDFSRLLGWLRENVHRHGHRPLRRRDRRAGDGETPRRGAVLPPPRCKTRLLLPSAGLIDRCSLPKPLQTFSVVRGHVWP